MGAGERRLIDLVDHGSWRARRAGPELLVFALGSGGMFGIDVLRVREVREMVPLTPVPGMRAGIAGVLPLRGSVIPAISLAACLGLGAPPADGSLLVAESGSSCVALIVDEVDRVLRVDADSMRAPGAALAAAEGPVIGFVELPGGRLLSILDLERIVAGALGATGPLPDAGRPEK